MLKVLHVSEAGGGVVHSISQICCGLAHEIKFHVLHGHRFATLMKDYQSYFPPSVEFTPWMVSREIDFRQDFGALRELNRLIRRIQPHVIHVHSSKAGGLARMLPANNGRKVIYSPRGYSFLRQDVSGTKQLVYRAIERVLGMCNHTTVACGIGEYRAALKVTKHAYLIPNMINLHEYDDFVRTDPFEAEISVAMVGRICPQKNFPLFCRIASTVDNLKFYWIGDGSIPETKIPRNVVVTGWLPKHKMLSLLSRCKIFLQTSLWEGLPIAVLEGMALSLAVLAKPAVGNTELVIEGVNGYLCDTEEEFIARLRELCTHPDRLLQFGKASRQLVEDHYSREKVLSHWRNLYFNYDRYGSCGII